MVKLDLYRGWFPPAELPSGERYMELLTAPEGPRQRPKVEVRALVLFSEGGRLKSGFFRGATVGGNVVIACHIPSHEGCKRQRVGIGRFVVRGLREVNICPL